MKPKDDESALQPIEDEINHSAETAEQAFLVFIAAAVIVMITAATTTDRLLFLGTRLELPLIGLGVQVIDFLAVAPVLLLFAHLYVLLQEYFLHRSIEHFKEEARKEEARRAKLQEDGLGAPTSQSEVGWRFPFHPSLAVLVAKSHSYAWWIRFLVQMFMGLVLVALPVAVLLIMLARSLPLHSRPLTGWLGALIVVDLVMSWLLLLIPRDFTRERQLGDATSQRRAGGWKWARKISRRILAIGFSVAVGAFLFFTLWSMRERPAQEDAWWQVQAEPRDLIPEEEVGHSGDDRSGQPAHTASLEPSATDHSPWWFRMIPRRNLILRDEPFGQPGEKPADASSGHKQEAGASDLRGRDFRNADFSRAHLTDLDLRGCDLRGADFREAVLTDVRLEDWRDGKSYHRTSLDRADFRGATLVRTHLSGAKMTGARFDRATLESVVMAGCDLRGATFRKAILKTTDLSRASLEGADFLGGSLAGTDLRSCSLRGGLFEFVEAPLIDFADADLEYSSFYGSRMDGAELTNADLTGADLRHTSLRGAIGLQGKSTRLEVADLRGSTWQADEFSERCDARVGRLAADERRELENRRKEIERAWQAAGRPVDAKAGGEATRSTGAASQPAAARVAACAPLAIVGDLAARDLIRKACSKRDLAAALARYLARGDGEIELDESLWSQLGIVLAREERPDACLPLRELMKTRQHPHRSAVGPAGPILEEALPAAPRRPPARSARYTGS